MGAVVAAFSSAPFRSAEGSSTGMRALPPSKHLDKYVTPTTEEPFFGSGLVNPDRKFKQLEVMKYIEGPPIDEFFVLVTDFTENAAFWGKLFDKFEQSGYKSKHPNGVGVWAVVERGNGNGRHYIVHPSQCDPKPHTFVCTLHA